MAKRVECPHKGPWRERISQTQVFYGCHACLKNLIRPRLSPALASYLEQVDRISTEDLVISAPKGLIETVDLEIDDRGTTYHMKGYRVLTPHASIVDPGTTSNCPPND